ncbi:acylpyruvate hydrolase [Marmoricola sp. URHA0025 HA25]
MKYTTVRVSGATRAARVRDDVLELYGLADVDTLLTVLASGDEPPVTDEIALAGADLAPVVTRPGKIVCVGANYLQHILEMGADPPAYPTLFAKYAESLIGAADDIVMPRGSEAVDWEAEIAAVIGTAARAVSPREALGFVAGYTVSNDVTARDFQFRSMQWLQGKTFEKTNPLGPFLVSGDEIDHGRDLAITCDINGRTVQDSRTSDMVFSTAELISYISHIVPLQVGDVIMTGTPSGVGQGRKPPEYLVPGDLLTTTVEGIGTLGNNCVESGEGDFEWRDASESAAVAP